MMGRGVQVALAVGAGYFLGRNRKLRLVLMLAGGAATGKLGGAPGQLLRQGTKMLGSADLGKISPELGKIAEITDTVRGPLAEAAKAAAMAAVTRQIDSLSDSLRDRAEALLQPGSPGSAKEQIDSLSEGLRDRADALLQPGSPGSAKEQIDSLSEGIRDRAGVLRAGHTWERQEGPQSIGR